MTADLFWKTIRDRRRSLIGWSVGLVAVVAVLCAYWPSVRDSAELQSFMNDLPEGMQAMIGEADYGTPEGFLSGELFSFMAPVLLLVVAIGMGARAIALEEERGTIDLLLSMPITRRRVLTEKVLAGLCLLFALGAVLFVSLVLGSAAFDMGIPARRLAEISLATVLVVLPFASLALLVSCITGGRGLAVGAATAAAIAAYLLDALAKVVTSLEGWDQFSPFSWYESDTVMSQGIELGNVALFVGVSVVLTVAAVVALERRDLAT